MDMSFLFGFENSESENKKNSQLDEAALATKAIFDSYVKVGFTRAEALEIIIGCMQAAISGGNTNDK